MPTNIQTSFIDTKFACYTIIQLRRHSLTPNQVIFFTTHSFMILFLVVPNLSGNLDNIDVIIPVQDHRLVKCLYLNRISI